MLNAEVYKQSLSTSINSKLNRESLLRIVIIKVKFCWNADVKMHDVMPRHKKDINIYKFLINYNNFPLKGE